MAKLMQINIGAAQFACAAPADLSAAIVEAIGCSVGEVRAMLAAPAPSPHLVARALAPFLDAAAPPMATIAALVANVPAEQVIAQVRTLYAEVGDDER